MIMKNELEITRKKAVEAISFCTALHLPDETQEKKTKQKKQPVSGQRIESRTFEVRSKSANHYILTFVTNLWQLNV